MAKTGAVTWFVLMTVLGAAGAFEVRAGAPPVALGLAAAVPPLVVVGLLAGSRRVRTWARGLDLRLLTTLQAWRAGGLAFLALAATGALPLGFALPAGLGDVLVGLTAPVVAVLVARGALGSAGYVAWTVFGIADLVVAVSLGILYSDSALGVLAGEIDTTLMSRLPMVIVPTFFVPLLLAVHALSLVAAVGRTPDAPRRREPATLPG